MADGNKRAMSLSEVVCHVTRTSGVTSLNLVEHDLIAKVQVPPMLLIQCQNVSNKLKSTLKLNITFSAFWLAP